MPVTKYKNFLDDDVFNELQKYCKSTLEDSQPNSSDHKFLTSRNWNYDIRKDSFPVLIHNLNYGNQELTKKILQQISKKIEQYKNKDITKAAVNIYYWTQFSYIPWHSDAKWGTAITIYLNDTWDIDNGGYYLYEDDGELKAVIPEKNLALIQSNGVRHCTTAVNYNAGIRTSLQVFFEH